MNNIGFLRLIFISIIFISQLATANIALPKLISDGMVLQRDKPLKIWGWADANEKVSVTFYGETYQTTTKPNKKWELEIPAHKAGGPFDMVVKGNNEIKISNILIGDVWLCGGQSNMDFTLNDLEFYENEIAMKEYDEIRQYKVKRLVSDTLAFNSQGSWKPVTPEFTGDFSATAYFFAKELYHKYKIPIGLINSNWGGSPAEVWMDKESLLSFPEIERAYQEINKTMISRIEKMKLRETRFPAYFQKSKDLDNNYSKFSANNFKSENWKKIMLPSNFNTTEFSNFDGIIWLRKTFEVPTNMVGKDLNLEITNIDDADETWYNGERIGTTSGAEVNRNYQITAKTNKSAKATIVIRMIDWGGGMGIKGELKLKNNQNTHDLSGEWLYKSTYNFKELPEFIEPDWEARMGWQPTTLYNGMINPLLNFPIKGAIWYQGESNAGRAYQYRSLFPAMIKNWREKFNQGDFPFLYVQLANFLKPDSIPKDDPWPELREAQTLTLKTLPNLGMALAIDLGEENDIHPKNKIDVGKRLAYQAMKVAYNDKKIIADGPIYESVKFEGDKAIVSFANKAKALIHRDAKAIRGFAIAGEDKKFYYADAEIIDANTLKVSSKLVANPVAVRYAWANNPSLANLYNSAGLPACPFRTDDWKGITFGVTDLK